VVPTVLLPLQLLLLLLPRIALLFLSRAAGAKVALIYKPRHSQQQL
jgi:hypothetical protein